jgi:hypothetical protein
MDFILTKFEDGRAQYKNDTVMAPLYQAGWEKMKKYYNLTNESPAYTAAIVLHPSFKWQYIQETWELAWLPNAEVNIDFRKTVMLNTELTFAEAS